MTKVLDETVVHEPLDQRVASPRRQAIRLVYGTDSSSTGEVADLLRRRLRFLGLLGTAIYAIFNVFLLFAFITSRSAPASGFGPLVLISVSLFFVFTCSTVVLWSPLRLSMGQLRIIELLAFGLVALHIALVRNSDLHDFSVAEIVRQAPPVSPPRYATFYSMPFFALIVTYGILIPNTGKRASLVVGLMAALPLFLVVRAGYAQGLLNAAFVRAMVAPLSMILAVSVALAVYSSYRITVLRRESLAIRQFGQYRLGQRLGTGGMGEVYLAEHVMIRRPCVIKLIRPDLAEDPTSVDRFETEVQATAALTSWNTVPIYDYGRASDGTFYYVMEYLPGLNLEQLVRDSGPLPAHRALHILRQIGSALIEAHGKGLVHRDIKPSNVIVGDRGGKSDVATLLDFGLVGLTANTMHGDSPSTGISGTPAYMSPEQARGESAIDSRSDLYSLGAVGFFLLTGEAPFARDSAVAMLSAHLHEPLDPTPLQRNGVPDDLQAVILKCLQKDPERRIQSAAALEQALASCAAT